MSDLHLWMQVWSNQGEKMFAMVEGPDKLDTNAIAFQQNDNKRAIEDSAANRGFEAWHAIVRRYDQRNMSDKKISICSVDQ